MKQIRIRHDWLALLLVVLSAVVVLTSVAMASLGTRADDFVIPLVQATGIILAGLLIAYLLYRLTTGWPMTGWFYIDATERIVISQIATVVRQNLPLAIGLALAAESERGSPRTQLQRISRLLAQGMTLSQAVRTGYPDCSAISVSLITVGEQTGQLPAALDQAEDRLFEHDRCSPPDEVPVWTYLLIVSGFAVLTVSGIMVAVVPKYQEIFKDFDVMLPQSTIKLIHVSDFFAGSGLLLGMLLIVFPLAIYLSLRPRRGPQLAFTSRLADWIRWHTPGWRRVEIARGMRSILQVMRLAVRAGMSLEPAARIAGTVDVNHQLGKRLRQFGELVDSGTGVREAACQSGLGEVTAVAMAAGRRGGDMDAALRYAADYHGAVASRWWILLRSLTWPLWTLALGIVVGWIVFALFQPLVALINSVAT
jgi:type IV pilus assembly protein PilC